MHAHQMKIRTRTLIYYHETISMYSRQKHHLSNFRTIRKFKSENLRDRRGSKDNALPMKETTKQCPKSLVKKAFLYLEVSPNTEG